VEEDGEDFAERVVRTTPAVTSITEPIWVLLYLRTS
jgi:hypothetical protein